MIFQHSTHQYTDKLKKLKTSKIIADGNSLTSGQGSTNGNKYPEQLSRFYPISSTSISITNLGVGAQTTLDMLSDAVSQVDTLYNEALNYNFLLVWEIRNHLVQNAPTNTFAFDKFKEYCLARKTAGFTVIIATISPSWSASYRGDSTVTGYNLLESDRLAINVMLREQWTDFADGLASFPKIGNTGVNVVDGYVYSTSTPAPSTNGMFIDGTHCTNAGYEKVSNSFLIEIYKLLK